MTLLPFKSPAIGLCIRAHALTAVEIRRDWRTGWRSPRLRSVAERALPAGLVRPSATELNITDVGKLADQIEGLHDHSGTIPIAVSLPDLCARTALFEFDTLPAKSAECESLLRWRFQKDLNLATEGSRLLYRIYAPHASRLTPHGAAGPARVLAVAIRRNIIEQYEQVCERARLIPVRVGLSTLALFDLCHPVLQQWMQAQAVQSKSPIVDEYFFASVSDESFSLVAVRHGIPSFVRMKNRNGVTAGGAAGLIPRATVNDELVATLQFYDESVGGSANPARPLFVVGIADDPQAWLEPAVAHALGIQPVPVKAEDFSFAVGAEANTAPASGLVAAAGLFAA